MKKFLIIPLIPILLVGCSIFQSQRKDIIDPPPRLNAKQNEAIQEQALVNYDLASDINEKGATPNSDKTITLRDGSSVILHYTGLPYRENIETLDVVEGQKIIDRARNVVEDYNYKQAKYDDKLDSKREKQISEVNTYWDWRKIFGGGFFTIILVGLGLLIASIFFPILLPVIQILWQLIRGGISAFKIFANLGVSGVVNIFSTIESFRTQHKGTLMGETFDTHMKQMPESTRVALDQFKNHYDI